MDPEIPGSSLDWVPIFHEARLTLFSSPKPSSLLGGTSVPEQLNIKAVTGAYRLIAGRSQELCLNTLLVAPSGMI